MHRHFKIYKPYGYLSQFITNERPRKKKKLLGDLGDFPAETMSIGRLDQDSEGLLFLTTSGKVSAKVNGNKIEKEYYVQVDGQITSEAIEQLKNGVEISINGERHGPNSWISITLIEGKFRQVKKMTAAVGFPTLRLVRVRIGNEKLKGMDAGEVIELSEFSL